MKEKSLKRWKTVLRERRAEGYIDVVVLVLCAILVIALAVRVFPIYITKLQLDNFADELIREAEIAGRVGQETNERELALREKTGLVPAVTWSATGNIQLNQEVTVTLTLQRDIGLFGEFVSFPVQLKARASGKSEVYYR